MIRSMWSAVSGLRNHQIYLDVTGNNIANVNTHGYKYTRAVFEDSLSQIVRNAAAPTPGADPAPANNVVGGINPAQIGLGVRLGQILGNFTQGGLQVTNVATDIAIQGDGFFMIDKGGQKFYTRNGAFTLDTTGNLVTSDGSHVQGYQYPDPDPGPPPTVGDLTSGMDPATGIVDIVGTPTTKINISAEKWQSFQVAPDGKISGVMVGDSTGTLIPIAQLVLTKFNNPPGLERVGGTMFRQTLNSGQPVTSYPNNSLTGMGLVSSGTLEMSNVDLAGEFTNLIMAQRGFQANSKVVSASDEVLQDLISMKR